MNTEANSSWTAAVPNTDDEFANFLDFPELDIDFASLDGAPSTKSIQDDQAILKGRYGQSGGFYAGDSGMRDDGLLQKSASAADMTMLKGRISGLQVQSGSLPPTDHPLFMGQPPMHFHGHGRIPPTPTSLDIHGSRSHFVTADPQQQIMYEAHLPKPPHDHMIFTPLGTPAVTPMDSQYQIPEYAVPGEYFSPLASPALMAQSGAPPDRTLYARFNPADHSETTSPIDVNFDPALKNAATSAPAASSNKRQKRRVPQTGSRASTRSVKDSPAMKPSKKKQPGSTSIPAKDVAEIMASANRPGTSGSSKRQGESLGLPASQQSSENGSISPEPLSDLMPPPPTPKPGSAGRSPNIPPQNDGTPRQTKAPITPRSLMGIKPPTSNQPAQQQSSSGINDMQDISLGEAAMDAGTFLPNIDTQMTDTQATPTMSAPKVDGSSTPMSPTVVLPSPVTGSAPTPKSLAANLKTEFKAPTKGKKRNSSSQQSPAIRPRISPSIKPLLPEGANINSETSALLLASKSNYQNILEGNHLPGVTYPEALSENLTSKRTSHKIAEQGRRNRINTALHEIASLLPYGKGGSEGEAASSSANQSSSKASTVEAAIDYIKSLQAELRDTQGKLADAQGKLKEMQGEGKGRKDG